MVLFRDRADAGRQLSAWLGKYRGDPSAIVLALPRGGVPVAYEVATALSLPLDVYTVRKLGVPGHEELAMGAVASGGSYVVDTHLLELAQVTPEEFHTTLARELGELQRREAAYRDDRPQPDLRGKAVLLVDDGLATGASMQAAIAALREREPAKIVVAVPVASPDSVLALEASADEIVTVHQPWPFYAVGIYYENFDQVEDAVVSRLLSQAQEAQRRWTAV
ncbi:MAG TPA: phosphoribosyltransferase [Candidatus Acidoferrum sp.]|nr:phosphoribosyltransferase [Candidatus Acidoferrum sp.]